MYGKLLTLCTQHYHTVYKHCHPQSVPECALCGSKRRHRVDSKVLWPFKSVSQPESINVLLHDTGNFDGSLTADSLLCSTCYRFCQNLLQQCDEDFRPPESIVHALRAKVDELQDRLRQCSNVTHHNEVTLLRTVIFLGEQMLSDQARTFPQLHLKYSEYLHSMLTSNVTPLPKYKVLIYAGKEFGDLLSSVTTHSRFGRILYRTKCDPFLMLSHALGTAEPQHKEQASIVLPVQPVADYLNEKVYHFAAQLMEQHEKAPVAASTFYLEAFARGVESDLWEAVTRITHSSNDKLGRKQSDAHLHERKVRIAYVVCVIVFCATGGGCSIPLQPS